MEPAETGQQVHGLDGFVSGVGRDAHEVASIHPWSPASTCGAQPDTRSDDSYDGSPEQHERDDDDGKPEEE
jgi:hypothetical protein